MIIVSKAFATVMVPVVLAAGCVKELPPLRTPERTIPTLELDPPPPEAGVGYVAFDVENIGQANVAVITEKSTATAGAGGVVAQASGETTRPICRTPCVSTLPYGNYQLRFSEKPYAEVAEVTVGPKPSVVRANLGHGDEWRWNNDASFFVGVAAGVVGLTALAVEDDGTAEALYITVGITAGISALLWYWRRPDKQRGASLQFQPPDSKIYVRR